MPLAPPPRILCLCVAQTIAELVADGITEIDNVKRALRRCINHYNHYLCKDSPPDPNDRAYFPTYDDLRNIYTEQNKLYNIQNMT